MSCCGHTPSDLRGPTIQHGEIGNASRTHEWRHTPANFVHLRGDVPAVDGALAAGGRIQARQQRNQGRLAGACRREPRQQHHPDSAIGAQTVVAQQGQDLPVVDGEIQVAQCRDLSTEHNNNKRNCSERSKSNDPPVCQWHPAPPLRRLAWRCRVRHRSSRACCNESPTERREGTRNSREGARQAR